MAGSTLNVSYAFTTSNDYKDQRIITAIIPHPFFLKMRQLDLRSVSELSKIPKPKNLESGIENHRCLIQQIYTLLSFLIHFKII